MVFFLRIIHQKLVRLLLYEDLDFYRSTLLGFAVYIEGEIQLIPLLIFTTLTECASLVRSK